MTEHPDRGGVMAPAPALRINSAGTGLATTVELGGQDVSSLLSHITFDCASDSVARVVVHFARLTALIEAHSAGRDVLVRVSEAERDALIALGWTPP